MPGRANAKAGRRSMRACGGRLEAGMLPVEAPMDRSYGRPRTALEGPWRRPCDGADPPLGPLNPPYPRTRVRIDNDQAVVVFGGGSCHSGTHHP